MWGKCNRSALANSARIWLKILENNIFLTRSPTELGPPPPPPVPPSLPNASEYFLGTEGQSCDATCGAQKLRCSPSINTGTSAIQLISTPFGSVVLTANPTAGWGVDQGKSLQQHLAMFNKSISTCVFKPADDKWWAPDQPNYVCGNDPNGNTNACVGWESVPSSVDCAGAYPQSCRVCHCVNTPSIESVSTSGPPGTGDSGPWGVGLFGHTAANGGVYSTVRMPFQKSFKATLTSKNSGTFWFIVRGVEDYPVVVGDLELPPQAKIRVHRFTQPTTETELVTLMSVPPGTAGAVLSVRFDAKSEAANGLGYLEACMRAMIDGATTPLFLSSGAEDYFLSAYYFNEGEFKTPNSGVTYYDSKAGVLSVYKIHDRDPLLWDNGFQLVFRNMEVTAGCGDMQHCPNQFCRNGTDRSPPFMKSEYRDDSSARGSTDAYYNTVVITYEWPRSATVPTRGASLVTPMSAAIAFIVGLGGDGLLDSEAEAKLVARIAEDDSAVTAVVQEYINAKDRVRAAAILTKLYA